MNMQIDDVIKKSRGYWLIDGFVEIIVGLFLAILGGVVLFFTRTYPSTFSDWFFSLAGEIPLIKLVGISVGILILWWLKEHFTYPRTGTIKTRRIIFSRVFSIIGSLVTYLLAPILLLLVISLLFYPASTILISLPIWLPIVIGTLWMILLILAGKWLGLQRLQILGGLIMIAGIAISILEPASYFSAASIMNITGSRSSLSTDYFVQSLLNASFLVLASGIILLFSGIATFCRYRKENPTAQKEGL